MAGKIALPDDLTSDVLGGYSQRGGGGGRETKLRLSLPNLMEGRATKRGGGGAGGSAPVSEYRRRVVVRLTYRKNGAPGGMSGLHSYVGYIQRPGAGEQQVSAGLFNATEENVLGHAVVARWRDDRHHFLPVISPNDGDKIGNAEVMRAKLTAPGTITEERVAEIRAEAFRSYTRDVMAAYEKRLGTKLEWFAGVHEKADRTHKRNRHVHVVIRGVDDTGADLVMDRNFIKNEMIRIAEEVATRRLGSMSASELAEYQRNQQRGRGRDAGQQAERGDDQQEQPEQQTARTRGRGRGAGL